MKVTEEMLTEEALDLIDRKEGGWRLELLDLHWLRYLLENKMPNHMPFFTEDPSA